MHLIKTPLGQAAFKERSALLSARQRALFILVDGQHTVETILSDTLALHTSPGDVEDMLQKGFLAQAAPKEPDTAANAALAQAAAQAPAAAPLPHTLPMPSLAPAPASAPAFTSPPPPVATALAQDGIPTPQARYQAAKPLATALSARLGLRGFLLNLSVEIGRAHV